MLLQKFFLSVELTLQIVILCHGFIECIREFLVLGHHHVNLSLSILVFDVEVLVSQDLIFMITLFLQKLSIHKGRFFMLLVVSFDPHISRFLLPIYYFIQVLNFFV